MKQKLEELRKAAERMDGPFATKLMLILNGIEEGDTCSAAFSHEQVLSVANLYEKFFKGDLDASVARAREMEAHFERKEFARAIRDELERRRAIPVR